MFKFTSLSNDSDGSVLNILKFLELHFPTNVEQGIFNSLVYMFSKGPRTEPCGTLSVRSLTDDSV